MEDNFDDTAIRPAIADIILLLFISGFSKRIKSAWRITTNV